MKTFWLCFVMALPALTVLPGCRKEPATQAEAEQKLAEAEKQAAAAQRQLAEARQQAEEAKGQAARGTAPGPGGAQPAGAAAPAAPEPKPLTIPAGTPIVVRTTTALSSKTVSSGAAFAASLEKELAVDGHIIAPKGADVSGLVVSSDPGGRVKGVASIAVTLKSISTPSGPLKVDTDNRGAQARSSVKKDVIKGGIMTGVGAAIGAIAGGGKGAAVGAGLGAGAGAGTALATRGDPAVIPAESVLTFRLKQPVTVPVK